MLGSGPGGYTAAFRAADLGKKVVLVERYPRIGGVCLNVGCIPSKALLHAAKVITDAEEGPHLGLSFGKPKIDLDGLRKFKDGVVDKLTGRPRRPGQGPQGDRGRGTGPVRLAAPAGGRDQRRAQDRLVRPLHHRRRARSRRASRASRTTTSGSWDSTEALELADVPKRLLIIGGGIIGLEMATVYDALGSKVTVVEFLDRLIAAADRRHRASARAPHREALREDPAQDQGHEAGGVARGAARHVRERRRAVARAGARGLRSRAAGRGAPPERQEHRRRQGGRDRQRARLHPRRQPDAHQRAAHLRHRRHRRRADAGAQGDPRGEAGRRSDRRDEPPRLGRPHDPERRLHRSRGRLDGPDRDRGQGARASSTRRRCSPGRASGRALGMGREEGLTKILFAKGTQEASWAPASSASMRAS